VKCEPGKRPKFNIKVTSSKVLLLKKGVFIMHLYLKYQSPNTFGSKDIAQVKVFFKLGQTSKSRSQGQTSGYQRKNLFIMHPYLLYQNHNIFASKDIAKDKVFQN
jgi:hypothetical protein